ncbi:MAG: tRNA (N6-threonylcarbamoyladenosine(37)-N6)-methyltransferase TrmO [Deltaproteobacteria bacterium]|nr:tRNA (N6-threonylcarbamoyladenosine(37)-N6)-methyltransferase TrmO [Deltaproteobacteria bacterium]
MTEDAIVYRPIGRIHTPFAQAEGAPIQPAGARDVAGTIVLEPELVPGLADLAGFSHLILLYHCHLSGEAKLQVKPFLDPTPRGVFATRAPARPNPLGLSVVRLAGIEGNVLHILDVDMLDNTPLLDLKPYVPAFDSPPDSIRTGWLAGLASQARETRADGRFVGEGEG